MIKSFQHSGLKRYWNRGQSQRIPAAMRSRIAHLLAALEAAMTLDDIDQPGYGLHRLRGFNPPRYAVSVTGNWRITFEWNAAESAAVRVNLEDYH